MKLPKWLRQNELFDRAELPDDSERAEEWVSPESKDRTEEMGDAHVIGSRFVSGRHALHKVFLDLDIEHYYVPSTTDGHAHLYLNLDVTDGELLDLMKTLSNIGIVNPGWALQVSERGQNTLRLPWVKKALGGGKMLSYNEQQKNTIPVQGEEPPF